MRSILLFLAITAAAQTPLPSGVNRIGPDVTAPVLIFKTEPQYSDEARKARLQGTVLVSVTIGEDGRPGDVRVIKSLGLGLDENAIASVAGWKFQPAKRSGNPVPVQSTVEVSFQLLLRPNEWHPAGISFVVPPGANQPVLLEAKYPPPGTAQDYAQARVSFDIDAQGVPRNIRVESSSQPPGMEDEVIALIREWRFQAALDHGMAVESKGYIDFTRGIAPTPAPKR